MKGKFAIGAIFAVLALLVMGLAPVSAGGPVCKVPPMCGPPPCPPPVCGPTKCYPPAYGMRPPPVRSMGYGAPKAMSPMSKKSGSSLPSTLMATPAEGVFGSYW